MEHLKQKQEIVLVTGASGGIGQATARRFALAGYSVALHYHSNRAAVDALGEELAGQCCRVMLQQADLRDSAQVAQMVQQIGQQWGPVGILVNNAGIAQQKLFTDITDADWHDMFAVHVDGAFYCTRAVLPDMIHRKQGCIINVSSMWGQTGGSCEVHYSAAKGALQAMTKALAKELAPSNIQVNAAAFGAIDTDMMRKENFTACEMQTLIDETAIGRIGTPKDVADVVSFLLSDKSSFITGQAITVDGGFV